MPITAPPPQDTARTAEHILAELAKTRCTAELLQPGELVSGMLLQVGRLVPGGWVKGCLVLLRVCASQLAHACLRCRCSCAATCCWLRMQVFCMPAWLRIRFKSLPSPHRCQVAHEPLLAATLSELIDSAKGNELHLRRPERYGLNGGTHTFAEVCGAGWMGRRGEGRRRAADLCSAVCTCCLVCPALPLTHPALQVGELARLRGETCIGFISAGGEMHLVPDSCFSTNFPKGARLVVLSES